jgi:hypothetical protein
MLSILANFIILYIFRLNFFYLNVRYTILYFPLVQNKQMLNTYTQTAESYKRMKFLTFNNKKTHHLFFFNQHLVRRLLFLQKKKKKIINK